jgi:uncharacterized phage-associated protein
MVIDKKKYEQAILYLCSKLGGAVKGKKKLAKLLYFADFDFFEKNNQSITGDTYKALPMGPFPTMLESVAKDMEKNGMLNVKMVEEFNGYNPTEIYSAKIEPDTSVFSADEKKMLDRVIARYGQLNGKQLEDLTHAEAPYIGTEPSQTIAYELSSYRGTDFGDL